MEENRPALAETNQADGTLMAAIFGEKSIRCYPYIYQERQEVGEGEETEEIFVAGIAYEVVKVPLNKMIQVVLEDLNEKERQVLDLRFGLTDGKLKSYKEIAPEFKVSRARIGQIIERSLRKLRHPSRSRRLREFLIPTPEERFKEKQRLTGLEKQEQNLKEEEKLAQNNDRKALEEALEITAANYQEKWGGISPYRRIHNALSRGGITQLSQLKALKRRELSHLRNIGTKSLDFLQEVLQVAEERFKEIGLERQEQKLKEEEELAQSNDRKALEEALEIASANYQEKWGGISPYRRIHNVFRHAGISQLSQLKALNRRDLYQLRNVGKKSLDFLQEVLRVAEERASP